jgi:hypothetical protein
MDIWRGILEKRRDENQLEDWRGVEGGVQKEGMDKGCEDPLLTKKILDTILSSSSLDPHPTHVLGKTLRPHKTLFERERGDGSGERAGMGGRRPLCDVVPPAGYRD